MVWVFMRLTNFALGLRCATYTVGLYSDVSVSGLTRVSLLAAARPLALRVMITPSTRLKS